MSVKILFFIILIIASVILLKYILIINKTYLNEEINSNSSLINQTVIEENPVRIFCMILTQNKSFYDNRVNI
jgi:hypothetical protein